MVVVSWLIPLAPAARRTLPLRRCRAASRLLFVNAEGASGLKAGEMLSAGAGDRTARPPDRVLNRNFVISVTVHLIVSVISVTVHLIVSAAFIDRAAPAS